jgi:hypothetical protein
VNREQRAQAYWQRYGAALEQIGRAYDGLDIPRT